MGKDRLLKACAVCGAEFHTARASQVCCSQKCRRERKQALQRIRRRVGKPQPQVKELTCTVCGKPFRRTRKGQSRKYCSPECADKGRRAYQVQRSMEIRNDLLPPPTRKCHDCGAPTSNYRCPRCLSDWKIKHAVSGAGDVDERYSICR